MKKIAILGSTGSIGTQALDIIAAHRDKFKVTGLSCANNIKILEEQIEAFKPDIVAVKEEKDAIYLNRKYHEIEVYHGDDGLVELALGEYDILLNALVGIKGMVPCYEASKRSKTIALANKESLVSAGGLITDEIDKSNGKLIPVDSEHSAIFQALQGNKRKELRKIYLTASGGPFRGYTLEQLERVSKEDALRHPNWIMGTKITIDSATMVNKGLEIIEAKWLFDVEGKEIEVVVHPQSIIHSMVEYVDNSIIAQMGASDMRVPISYAFNYPDRLESHFEPLDIFGMAGSMNFEKPDLKVFKTIQMAYDVLEAGGTYPTVLNGANEALVELFLKDKIKFVDIQNILEAVINEYRPETGFGVDSILEADRISRKMVLEKLGV